MSQSSPAHAARSGGPAAQGGTGSALAPRNWRVATRLIILVAIPAILGLALAGLRITDTARSAAAYGQVARLAALSRQVTGLTQALEDERTAVAGFIAQGRPAAGQPALQRQYLTTDRWAATVRRLLPQLEHGYPAQTQASAAAVRASLAGLPGLRRHAAQPQAPALAVLNSYSATTARLFAVDDGIADLSDNATLISSVRALGSLSRMKDQASLQQAILGAALAQGHFDPGALTALTSAQAQQASDLDSFRGSATLEQSWALATTLAGRQARQAQAVEQRAVAAGAGSLALGAQASQQWRAGMSYTVGWMRQAEQQLTDWITGYAQSQQQSAIRSALVTGGAALAALALVLAAALLVARSMVRPLRRLEAAAGDVAGAHLPAAADALGVAGQPDQPVPVTPIDVSSRNEVGDVARAVDEVHQEAVRLAAEQAWHRASVSALSARFFRRSYSLQERLLQLIDHLELSEDDPERLASLFQMDHLVTRMRRDSDSALILAGDETQRDAAGPFSLVDVIRAAVSEIEQYDRVVLNVQQGVLVSGSAAADTVHLLAELLENATSLSARTAPVNVCGQQVRDGGCLISIADGGGAMSQDQLRQLNWQLAHPAAADAAFPRHVGLSAVGHLAARHGIDVMLKMPPDGGTTAEVHLPGTLISQDGMPGGWLRQAGGVPVDVPFSAVRFAGGPMSPREAETATREPAPLSAPVPPPAPAAPYADPYADQETAKVRDRDG